MFRSLRYKLIFTIVIVSVIAVAAVGLFSSRVVSVQLDQFLFSDAETSLEHFSPILEEYYRQHREWNRVEPVLDRVGSIGRRQLILLDTSKNVVAGSPAELRRGKIEIDNDYTFRWHREQVKEEGSTGNSSGKRSVYQYEIASVPHILLTDENGIAVGTLCLIPIELNTTVSNTARFTGSVNQALFLATLVSAVIAAIFAVFLGRRIVKPVEALKFAVQQMEKGNLNQLVAIYSKDEIGNLAHAFNSMARSLAMFERQRLDMLNDIAHELRTPLTTIRCQIEAIQDGLETANAKLIESLHEEVMLLARLMDDLQELALAETGCLRLNNETLSLNDEISRAINALKYQIEAKHLSIATNLQDKLSAVNGDAQRIGQALKNILQNSIKYTPPRGEIFISSQLNESYIEIKIADTGAGISPEHLPFVFDRFYRADPSRNRATGGSGLGLAIVKRIIEAHDGSVRIESSMNGGGTIVYLTIPTSNIT